MTAQVGCAVTELADAVIDLGELALTFGEITRTAVYHADRCTREDDAEHTVMLGWVATAVAARCFPALDLGLVAQFALVHDAVEVYAGDTPTLRIDAAGRAAKAAREHAALARLTSEFGENLPWFPATIAAYEEQEQPEARFVRGMDKIMPKIVHLLDGCIGLIDRRIGVAELERILADQQRDLTGYVGEFAELMALYAELGGRVLAARGATESDVDDSSPTVPCGFDCGYLAHSEADLDHHEAECDNADVPCSYTGPVTGADCIMPAGHDNGIHDRDVSPARPVTSLRRSSRNGGAQ